MEGGEPSSPGDRARVWTWRQEPQRVALGQRVGIVKRYIFDGLAGAALAFFLVYTCL